MKAMVIGGGGREHALAWKLAQSKSMEKVYCAPGNAGIAKDAECVDIKADDLPGIKKFAMEEKIDLVVVGPEAPLVAGLVDELEQEGITAFGASKKAAILEGSKVFAKKLMQKHGIPTGGFEVFIDPEKAKEYINKVAGKLVLKADGLAAGKGVIVCDSKDEAIQAVKTIMEDRAFGQAGEQLLVEERLFGEEASFLAFTDGDHIIALESSQDHKAIYDGDKGPNTGGMGAYSPAPVVDKKIHKKIMDEIMAPTIMAMEKEGRPYKGILYAGLMITSEGPKVLEFNARFGDPETQPLLFRLKSDLASIMMACAKADGSLKKMTIEWDDPTVCVVMAAKGYPGAYDKHKVISGLADAEKISDAKVFHAGTLIKDGDFVTAGGRVLGVTARGSDIEKAIEKAYEVVGKISWEGAYYRKDIGKKAIDRK